MTYKNVKVPVDGATVSMQDGKLQVPDNPILPYIEGDGVGRDIWKAAVGVFDAAVEKAYGGTRKIHWMEVYAGEKAHEMFNEWLPEETLAAFREFLIGIKGPLLPSFDSDTRSLNVDLNKQLDLYVCQRPVKYMDGVPSPMKHPENVDMVIFRENSEDIYTGAAFEFGTEENAEFKEILKEKFSEQYGKFRWPNTASVGIKPISKEGTQRLVRAAIQWALENGRKDISLVHKGNIQKFTEGAFRNWGYELAKSEFRNDIVTERETWILGNKEANPDLTVEENAKMVDPGFDMMAPDKQQEIIEEVKDGLALWDTHGDGKWKSKLRIRDTIADIVFQQTITRAKSFDVLATMNLNGDYLSDALAAQTGGMDIAPGANINYESGRAIFEATHGAETKYADLDQVNPSSLILSGEMMFRYMGWHEAADLILKGMRGAIAAKTVTHDFEQLMEGATSVKCSEFGEAIIKHMDD